MPIQVRGLDKLLKKLNAAAAIKTLDPPMRRGVLRLQRFMQEYPPKPAHSTYRRTGTLGRRWTVRITHSNGGLTGKVGNNTQYGPLVQSQQFQQWFHRRTGWRTDEQAVKENEKAILADFQHAIDAALAE